MTGTALDAVRPVIRGSFPLLAGAVLLACGAPAETTPSATRSPSALASPASPSSSGEPAPAAAPSSDPRGWPFGPAPTADETKAQLERLGKDPGPIRTNWTPPGKSDRYGHAEGLIGAPYDVVKERLLDFPHYKELAGPKFKKVTVVEKQASGTDLYFQLPIMKGLVTIWYVTRFGGSRPAPGGGDLIEGTFVKGNIKDMQIVFTLRHGPDERSTVLVCDLVLAITIPAPQSALDEELRDACGDALNAVRARTAAPPPPPP